VGYWVGSGVSCLWGGIGDGGVRRNRGGRLVMPRGSKRDDYGGLRVKGGLLRLVAIWGIKD